MAGRTSGSDRTRSYKTTTASTKKSSTRRFATVSSSSSSRAKLAREKQRRQYEQQKREKLIFALFVVIILVMILFAILIFKKIVGDAPADTNDTGGASDTVDTSDNPSYSFKDEMVARDRIYQGSLILVDATSPRKVVPTLTDLSAVSGKAYQMSGLGSHMEAAAADAFVQMTSAEYNATGTKLLVYLCYEEDETTGDLGSGLTVDVAVFDGSSTYVLSSADCSEEFNWLKDNAAKYGFVILSPEKTGRKHYAFRYVGVPHASYMEENDLSLTAYLESLRTHHADEPISVVNDGVHYTIYYVEATDGDMTAVPIPKDAVSVEVSGDNADGFIVTARMD